MWSFGCIMVELVTKSPLFPALDENELIEFFVMTVGNPTQQMLSRAKKRHKFFGKDGKLIRSKNSRLENSDTLSYPLMIRLDEYIGKDFIDLI